jgi:predicted SAM-dependent methyltransferase
MVNESSEQTFFQTSLPPEEVEQILRRIDENLALRPLFHEQGEQAESPAIGSPPPFPNFAGMFQRIQALQGMQAPFFAIKGHALQRLVRRGLNAPIKVFGHKQASFNRDLLDAVNALVTQLQGLRQQAEYQRQIVGSTAANAKKAHDQLADALSAAIQKNQRQIEQIAAKVEATSKQQAQAHANHHQWLQQIAKQQQGQHDWTRLIQRKLEMLALDVREHMVDPAAGTSVLPEPRVVDPAAYAERLAEFGDRLRVQLGCGEKPLPEYINIDFRELPQVDVVADVRRLPFEPETLAEIASAHLVEHFREHQLRARILPYWKSLLRPGGMLRIICPNWAAMLERLNDGRMSLADFKRLTFGAQDYEGDDHFAMYTPETLGELLMSCGFKRVEVVATERMNGLCPEMELVAFI